MINIVRCQKKSQFSAKLPRDDERRGENKSYTGNFIGVVRVWGYGAQALEMSNVSQTQHKAGDPGTHELTDAVVAYTGST